MAQKRPNKSTASTSEQIPTGRRVNHTHRTARVPDPVWDKAKARAEEEGVAYMSDVVQLLLRAYGDGKVDLPQVGLIYPDK